MSATASDSFARGSEEALPYIIHRCALVSRFDLAGRSPRKAMLRRHRSRRKVKRIWPGLPMPSQVIFRCRTDERSERALRALRLLHHDHPEPAVREWLAKARSSIAPGPWQRAAIWTPLTG